MNKIFFLFLLTLMAFGQSLIAQNSFWMSHIDNAINFEFVDITNLVGKDAAHVSALSLIFHNSNNITIAFTFTQAGNDHIEKVDLHRS